MDHSQHDENTSNAEIVVDWRSEQQTYHLGKAYRIIKKYHSRCFLNNLKSAVLLRLIQDNTRHQQKQQRMLKVEVDWPYRSLLLKPNKSEHELLEIQFVSMCAEKIQAVFKGYLTRKRFRIAFARLKRFSGLALAFVRGWKVRNVMRCLKMQEEARSIKVKRGEVEKEVGNANQTGRFNQRKVEYLKGSLQAELAHFHRRFKELYEEGAWVFQPRQPFPRFQRVQKWSQRKQVEPMKENSFNQAELQVVQFIPEKVEEKVEEAPKKKRVREMRDNAKRGRNKQQPPQEKKQQDMNATSTQQQTASEVAFSQASTNVAEDRPIQAKGAYTYNEENAIKAPEVSPGQNEAGTEQNEERKALLKRLEKKKHEKRQKYDPRKAIQEEKRRKKEQQQQEELRPKEEVHSETEIAIKAKAQSQKEVIESKSQKVLKPERDEANRSTVNLPKNKPKVQARIDCWGNRKTVAKKAPQEYIKAAAKVISAPSIQVEEEEYNRVDIVLPSERLAAKIHERRGKGKERLEYSEEREKARIEIQRNCEESQRIKEELQRQKEQEAREAEAVKQHKAQMLRERQRAAQEQKDKRKDLVYRSVEELSETYKNQYLTRFQNLFPKLSLLAAARNSQQNNLIPVLTLDSDFVERMMQENKLNQRFWYTVSKMERRFKDFVKGEG